MKPETGHFESPNWDTPPNGDFAAYVQRLTAPAEATAPVTLSPLVPVKAQTPKQKTPAHAASRKRPSFRQRHAWLAAVFAFAARLVAFIGQGMKFLLTITLLFVPFGGVLQTILARYAYGIAIMLAALLLGVVLAPFLGVWGALTVLLATLLAGALWSYRHTRFVRALGAAWRQWLRRFSDPPNPV